MVLWLQFIFFWRTHLLSEEWSFLVSKTSICFSNFLVSQHCYNPTKLQMKAKFKSPLSAVESRHMPIRHSFSSKFLTPSFTSFLAAPKWDSAWCQKWDPSPCSHTLTGKLDYCKIRASLKQDDTCRAVMHFCDQGWSQIGSHAEPMWLLHWTIQWLTVLLE